MATLILRNTKGSALTFDELDSNFLALDSDITSINNTIAGGVGLGADSVNSLIDNRIDSDTFVRITTDQTIAGVKTFSDSAVFSSPVTVQGVTYPDSAGRAGQLLTTHGDGSTSFDSVQAGAINDVFWENSQLLTADHTIAAGRSALSAGPITIASGVTATIDSDSRWVIL